MVLVVVAAVAAAAADQVVVVEGEQIHRSCPAVPAEERSAADSKEEENPTCLCAFSVTLLVSLIRTNVPRKRERPLPTVNYPHRLRIFRVESFRPPT
jgi:hypothetical protein